MEGDGSPQQPAPKRGFAAMSAERQREIAAKGGRASHLPGGKGHEWTSEQAKIAGSKGGRAGARTHRDALASRTSEQNKDASASTVPSVSSATVTPVRRVP